MGFAWGVFVQSIVYICVAEGASLRSGPPCRQVEAELNLGAAEKSLRDGVDSAVDGLAHDEKVVGDAEVAANEVRISRQN